MVFKLGVYCFIIQVYCTLFSHFPVDRSLDGFQGFLLYNAAFNVFEPVTLFTETFISVDCF